MSFKLEHSYAMPLTEARARLQALGDYLHNKHGLSITWDGDRASIAGRYLVVPIEGQMSIEPGMVKFEGKDPGFMWRGKAKDYLSEKLASYLDPATPADKLARG